MSVLVSDDIKKRIDDGSLSFKPRLDNFQLNPHSIDLRLGYTYMIPKSWRLTKKGRESLQIDYYKDGNKDIKFDMVELEKGQYFDLLPNEYIIVSTLENLKVPDDLMGVLYPRSSTNRRGLSVDLSGVVDAGYEGQLIIPIKNNTLHQVIRLYPGERICQIIFEDLNSKVKPRKSRYHKKDIIDGFSAGSLPKEKEVEIAHILEGSILDLKEYHPLGT
jgi:dCTP deaminase